MPVKRLILISFIFSISIFNASFVAGESPLTPKAYLLRYWNKEIRNDLPKSSFLLEKASPLNGAEAAKFATLALDQTSLSSHLHSFCKSAKLLCFPDSTSSLDTLSKAVIAVSHWSSVGGTGYSKNRIAETNPDSHEKNEVSGEHVNKQVEPEFIFFRESMLKKGNVMPMPDIRDTMPKRAFLPRSIVSKLPFSLSKFDELKSLFHAVDNSPMEKILSHGLNLCEHAPSPGEAKRCVGSVEDMIDFATSVLGRSILVRNTETAAGSMKDIMIGSVKGINGGKDTKSVTCHISLYPYLLYYCHSLPKIHVYEAEIMDAKTKAKINNGLAICHMDTSTWSPTHEAFLSLGSSPGKIEVCHWIPENDMTWTTADSE